MPNVTIYHNPRCTKSRQTLALIEEKGFKPKIIEYLTDPPTAATLTLILKKLKIPARQLMRRKEPLYAKLKLDSPKLTEQDLIKIMVDNPILIERPIVVVGQKACLGRPPENVLEIL